MGLKFALDRYCYYRGTNHHNYLQRQRMHFRSAFHTRYPAAYM